MQVWWYKLENEELKRTESWPDHLFEAIARRVHWLLQPRVLEDLAHARALIGPPTEQPTQKVLQRYSEHTQRLIRGQRDN